VLLVSVVLDSPYGLALPKNTPGYRSSEPTYWTRPVSGSGSCSRDPPNKLALPELLVPLILDPTDGLTLLLLLVPVILDPPNGLALPVLLVPVVLDLLLPPPLLFPALDSP
jgi:hypothetical protein